VGVSAPALRTFATRGERSKFGRMFSLQFRGFIFGVLLSALALFGGVPGSLHAQETLVEGSVQGEIVELGSGRGVPAVRVEFLDAGGRTRASATTDATGRFRMDRVPSGPFRLRASRFGYVSTESESLRVEIEAVAAVTLEIEPAVIPLAAFEVTSDRDAPAPLLEPFQARRQRGGGGFFLTREDVLRTRPIRLSDLLKQVPGIQVTRAPGVHASRLVSMTPSGPARSTGNCPVQVFLDGKPAARRMLAMGGGTRSLSDGIPIDDLVRPEQIEGVEIYRASTGVPSEFRTPDAECGVIAIWTRR
jgi:hypothetical protein